MYISQKGDPETNKSTISFYVLWSSAVQSLIFAVNIAGTGDDTTLAEADKTDKTNTAKTAFAMIMEANGNNGRSRGQ